MNTRDALQIARSLGVEVCPVRRTDELRFISPFMERTVVIKGTRKDASRAVMVLLKRHQERAMAVRAAG